MLGAADDMDELVQAVKQAIQQCCLQVCLPFSVPAASVRAYKLKQYS